MIQFETLGRNSRDKLFNNLIQVEFALTNWSSTKLLYSLDNLKSQQQYVDDSKEISMTRHDTIPRVGCDKISWSRWYETWTPPCREHVSDAIKFLGSRTIILETWTPAWRERETWPQVDSIVQQHQPRLSEGNFARASAAIPEDDSVARNVWPW